MDIVAKHIEPDRYGVRIASLNEMSYRRILWNHRPLTDFWRIGKGYAKKLEEHGIFTMGDVARCSLGKAGDYYNEDLLYRLFGVNAELLIDHAWGWEPCTMADIKAYRPQTNSICAGHVLHCPYESDKASLVLREMADSVALDLFDKRLATDQLVLTVSYDIENLTDPKRRGYYKGEIVTDQYGRKIPKHAHGTVNLGKMTSSAREIIQAATDLYDKIVDHNMLIRKLQITANRLGEESPAEETEVFEQMDLFTDYASQLEERKQEKEAKEREKKMQQAMLDIKKKYGKNAVLKGMSLEKGATARERNNQIGGHRA